MFRKVLVANRGEIAVRIIRTCREMGIEVAAVYSDADREALHVRLAGEAVSIGPAPASESYLCIPTIIDAARRVGAEALHPGYGFLSENPALPNACEAAGITFVGPQAAAMRLLGDKSAARRLAVEQGVPVLPGLDDGALDDAALLKHAVELGFPVMVKAVGGGGGRGMRIVPSVDVLDEALASARREAVAAFGDDRLLLERAVVGGRHVEIQVLADAHGNLIHLGERDCSIQRRHQKVVEESPSPGVTPELRERMCEAAVTVARAAGYVNAGTVEFLVDRENGFYFLEMNTRLQVEHGVTELVSGLDLVELQLRVAAGEELPIRQDGVRLSGHAIECRVYAEDPAGGYVPSSGRVTYFLPPDLGGARNDVGVASGIDVPAEYDPLLAKLLVHAPSREEAVDRCARALGAYAIEGVKTNLGQLQAVLADAAFVAGTADLATLEAMPPEAFAPRIPDDALLAAAAFEVGRFEESGGMDPWEALTAWRIDGRSPLEYTYHGRAFAVGLERAAGRLNAWHASIDGRDHDIEASSSVSGHIVIREAGVESRWAISRDGSHLLVETEGRRYVLGRPSRSASNVATAAGAMGAGTLRAPMPGVVARVLVAEGDHVSARQPLVLLEAMKMEHIIESNVDGVVTRVACSAGRKVSEGEMLIELETGESQGDEAP